MGRYDSADTLFYLDPPYFGGETDYGKGMFARADFREMAHILSAIRGAFVMSINDTPEIRGAFAPFFFEEVSLTYTVSTSGTTDARELLLSNREQTARLLQALPTQRSAWHGGLTFQ